MRCCIDSSVLLSLFIEDSLTNASNGWLQSFRGEIAVSRWALCEFSDVIQRKQRNGQISAELTATLIQRVLSWAERQGSVPEGEAGDFNQAYDWLSRPNGGLRSNDALHVAIAKRLNATLITGDATILHLSGALGISVTFLEPQS